MKPKKIIFIAILTTYLFGQPPFKSERVTSDLKIHHKQVLLKDNYNSSKLKWKKENTIGTILMLSCGALSYYFNEEADKYYSRYLETGNRNKMNSFYDKTKKYDNYKYLSYLGLEIGVAINFWALIKDD